MIRDVQFGFLLLLAMAVAIGQRVLPRFADPGGENPAVESAQATSPSLSLPGLDEPVTQERSERVQLPSRESPKNTDSPNNKQGVLTTIFPKGYKDKKSAGEKPADPELVFPGDVSSPGKSNPEGQPDGNGPKQKPADDGPVMLIDKNTPKPGQRGTIASDKAPKGDKTSSAETGDDGPVLALPADDVVTEFVPYVETEEVKRAPDARNEDEKQKSKASSDSSKVDRSRPIEEKVVASKEEPGSDLTLPLPSSEKGQEIDGEEPTSPRPWPKEKVLSSAEGIGSTSKNPVSGNSRGGASKGEKVPTVLSYDVRPEGTDSTPPIVKTGRGPVHPFFQRYLDRKTYYVREGDDLRRIAEHLYQDEKMVPALFEANKHQLTRKEDLRPGMLLRLP